MKTCLSFIPVAVFLCTLLGACVSAPPPPPPAPTAEETLAMEANYRNLLSAIERELSFALPAAGLAPWSSTDAEAAKGKYSHVVAGWKGVQGAAASRIEKTVMLFSDPMARRLAIIIYALDADGRTVAGPKAELEELVGRLVAGEKLKFERMIPDVVIGEQRDQVQGANPNP